MGCSSQSEMLLFGIICMNVCSLFVLMFPNHSLANVAVIRQDAKNAMEAYKIKNKYQKIDKF